ncbi:MAG: Methyltransferase domain protein [Bacteroidetes bacterium ADurb.Bin145]|nr:MAG: Methyltransferase domain protein [Bacteroidetes bacterium ADurb.Bin145]
MLFDFRQKLLAKTTSKYDVLLDIGYAEIPNKYLTNKQVIGIDLHTIEKPSNYSKVIVGDASNLADYFDASSINAVCCGELLEHLVNPIDFLKGCHNVLKPNGILALTTPNPHHFFEFVSTIFLSKKFFYSPGHVCIYPQRWLIRMFEIAGFTDIKVMSGGLAIPFIGTIWFPRPIAEFTFVSAKAHK